MSTKRTLFLTSDNEHLYKDGDTIIFEMSKKNVNILVNDDDDLVVEFTDPTSELYKRVQAMSDGK
jgi:predicted nuclease of predicted toxin-antitoxin system